MCPSLKDVQAKELADDIEKNGLCNDPLWPKETRQLIVKALRSYGAIEEHNAECVRLCNDRKRCGYEGYRSYMKCPECPKDWMIDQQNAAPQVAATCTQHEWSETPVCLICGVEWKHAR